MTEGYERLVLAEIDASAPARLVPWSAIGTAWSSPSTR
jgi:hypothetical protein